MLDEAGFGVLLPSWWDRRRKLGLALSAHTSVDGVVSKAGKFGRDQLVEFRWELAVGDDTLTEDEIAVMRQHPKIGHELLSGSQNRFIQTGALIALRHHERYDGSGYPDGLIGDEIPLEARIVAVADVFDALISPRPYKHAWELDAALAYLYSQRGRLFDPRCVDALIRNRERLEDICQRFSRITRRPGME